MFFMSETHTPHHLCQKKPQKPCTKYKGDFKLFDYSIIISPLCCFMMPLVFLTDNSLFQFS